MKFTKKRFSIKAVYAHCDLPCGVYDPAQAHIEAQSVHNICLRFEEASDQDKTRAILIKEQRAELIKHHLWVLWTDYFKKEHLDSNPELHDKFWQATKQAGAIKKTTDSKESQKLLNMIDEIDKIFQSTK
jgi:nickel superoxide dismutase